MDPPRRRSAVAPVFRISLGWPPPVRPASGRPAVSPRRRRPRRGRPRGHTLAGTLMNRRSFSRSSAGRTPSLAEPPSPLRAAPRPPTWPHALCAVRHGAPSAISCRSVPAQTALRSLRHPIVRPSSLHPHVRPGRLPPARAANPAFYFRPRSPPIPFVSSAGPPSGPCPLAAPPPLIDWRSLSATSQHNGGLHLGVRHLQLAAPPGGRTQVPMQHETLRLFDQGGRSSLNYPALEDAAKLKRHTDIEANRRRCC